MAKNCAKKTGSAQKCTKAVVADKRTAGPQKTLPLASTAVVTARPRTRQQAKEEKRENKTKIKLGQGLILTCTALGGESEVSSVKTVQQNHPSRQERGVGRNGEVRTDRSAWIGKSKHEMEISDEVTMTAEEEVTKGKHRWSRTALAKQLERMSTKFGNAQAEIVDLRNALAGKEAELEGLLSFLNHGDSLSGADAIDFANSLNADIFQGAAHIAEMLASSTFLTDHETDSYKSALEQAHMSLGQELADALTNKANWGANKFVVQIALQVCMVTFCVNVILSWSPEESENGVLTEAYARIVAKESQAVAGRWRSVTRGITQQERDPEALRNAIIGTITDILVVAGCWGDDRDTKSRRLFKKFHENLERVVEGALKLQIAVGMDITCMDIAPLTIRPGSPFDHKRMEDAYAGQDMTVDGLDRVLCTTELGLSRTVAVPEDAHQDILLRPKILLQSALRTRDN